MKICLLGEYSGDLDEGMRKVSLRLAEELTKRHQILTSDLGNVFAKSFWKEIKVFNPEIVHYIHGPSIKSFMLLKIISVYCRNSKSVMSAMHPYFTFLSKRVIPLFKSDLILTQSCETEDMFKKLGCGVEFLPCGVDINKFMPVTVNAKEELRVKYGIDKEKFVILHVGSIKEGRNVQLLEKLQKEGNQVLIIGAVSTGVNKVTACQLKKSGCLVLEEYLKNIEEVYALADCYVFPTLYKKDALGGAIASSIEMPLSVLEAMSCNLPVITTKFGALPRVFEEGEGLFFVEEEDQFIATLEGIKYSDMNIKTREKVLPYSWECVGKELGEIYLSVLGGGAK